MYGNVQRIKLNREQGQFSVAVSAPIPSVVTEVAARLREQYTDVVSTICHQVAWRAHPEYAVLIVTPVPSVDDPHLECKMRTSMRHYVADALSARAGARAS